MAVEFPFPIHLFVIGPVLIASGAVGFLAGRRLIRLLRQSAYDFNTGRDTWTLRVDPDAPREPDAAERLIAGLHSGIQRGTSWWAAGWPEMRLAVHWHLGAAHWEIEAPRQLARVVEAAVMAAYPDAELEQAPGYAVDDPGDLRLGLSGWPPSPTAGRRRAPSLASSLVELMSRLPEDADAQWLIRLRPMPAARRASTDTTPSLLSAVVAAGLNQPSPKMQVATTARTAERAPLFSVSASLDVRLLPPQPASARAWLFDASSLVSVLRSAGWEVGAAVGRAPRPMLADPAAIAELWSPPGRGDATRAIEVVRSRLLTAPPRLLSGERAVGTQAGSRVHLPADLFLRHAAFIGSTGSGKSTQLMALAADDLLAGRGFTFIDPHGDAVRRLLDAVPPEHVDRVHLIELAERDTPRGFNFLELGAADPELVAVQFVDTLYDLYAKYSGPKQTHYLRMALLTLLARPPEADGPWTVVDLYQLLVNRDVRRRFTEQLADEVLRDFWSHEWPLDRPHVREQSVEAVLNKLGGFIAYPTIRDIVGARHSTIRPRAIMDAGEVLLVDLSRVGRDHARLFGSMLIGRYYIDALARQGSLAAQRRPHLLYVDELHNFDTSSLRGILTETRKFGLGLVTATQYVRRLQPELAAALRSNVATLGLLQPSAEDVADLFDLFEPLSRRDLLNLPRFRMALRTEVDGERMLITPNVLPEPPALGSADVVRHSSDQRDGRWRP